MSYVTYDVACWSYDVVCYNCMRHRMLWATHRMILSSYRMRYRIRYRIRYFYWFDQGNPKFQIAFAFRFTLSCQCFYNNAIQQLTLTLPPRPPYPPLPLLRASPAHVFWVSDSLGRKQGQHAENCCMHAAPLRGGGRCGAARRLPPLLHCAATAGDALYRHLRRCCTAWWQQQMQSFEAWWPAATGMGSMNSWSLKCAHVVMEMSMMCRNVDCSNEDMIFQLSCVQETIRLHSREKAAVSTRNSWISPSGMRSKTLRQSRISIMLLGEPSSIRLLMKTSWS